MTTAAQPLLATALATALAAVATAIAIEPALLMRAGEATRPAVQAPRLHRPAPAAVAVRTTRTFTITYRAHTGDERTAVVLAPAPYDGTPLPLVISPHGRGGTGAANASLWGDLPAIGGFVVVNPDGAGDHLGRFSWGASGQIDDLARMPEIVEAALPWLRLDRNRVYAFGGSMGGQETLLLVARHPELLAGAAAFDSLVDFAHQYDQFPRLKCKAPCAGWGGSLGDALQRLAREEVGGTPDTASDAYEVRSPIAHAGEIARSGVPLQLWWSTEDQIVVDSAQQSGALLAALRAEGPAAAVTTFVGTWAHTHEMRHDALLPHALATFGLVPASCDELPQVPSMQIVHHEVV